jgi:hypothetical protein
MMGCFAIVAWVIAKAWSAVFGNLSSESARKIDNDEELSASCGYDTRGLLRCPECGMNTAEERRRRLTRLREAWPTDQFYPGNPKPQKRRFRCWRSTTRWPPGCCASISKREEFLPGFRHQTAQRRASPATDRRRAHHRLEQRCRANLGNYQPFMARRFGSYRDTRSSITISTSGIKVSSFEVGHRVPLEPDCRSGVLLHCGVDR